MAAENFNKSLMLVLKHEGGYVDHPRDPGGATNKGITRKTLAAWRGVNPWWDLPKSEVKAISDEEVAQIYKAQYWDRVNGDQLPHGVGYCVFDYAVNSGVSRSSKELQRVVGVSPDGVIGSMTLDAVRRKDPTDIINTLCDRRLAFLKRLRTWGTFGRGWSSRVAGVRRQSMFMAGDAPVLSLISEPVGKAYDSDESMTSMAAKGAVTSEAATITGGAGAALSDVASQLLPFSDYSDVIKYLFIGLLIAGAGFTIWKMLKRYRAGEA